MKIDWENTPYINVDTDSSSNSNSGDDSDSLSMSERTPVFKRQTESVSQTIARRLTFDPEGKDEHEDGQLEDGKPMDSEEPASEGGVNESVQASNSKANGSGQPEGHCKGDESELIWRIMSKHLGKAINGKESKVGPGIQQTKDNTSACKFFFFVVA